MTLRLFPSTLYCCFNVTESGKLNSDGKPNSKEISDGEKYLSRSSFSTRMSPEC